MQLLQLPSNLITLNKTGEVFSSEIMISSLLKACELLDLLQHIIVI